MTAAFQADRVFGKHKKTPARARPRERTPEQAQEAASGVIDILTRAGILPQIQGENSADK